MGLFQVAHLRSGAAPLQCARSGLSTSPPAVIRPFTRAAAAPRATPRPSRSHYVARRRPQRLAATPADPAPVDGNGSSNGSGNGGGGGGGSGGGDDAEGQSQFNANIWLLTMAAAAALGLFKVGSKRLQAMQQQQQARATAAGATAGAAAGGAASGGELDTDDVRTLTRLTQEAFAELVKVRARLDELEEEAGIAGAGSAPADASLVSSSGGAARGSRRRLAVNGSGSGSGGQHQPRHRLAGVVRLGGGAMWAQVRACVLTACCCPCTTSFAVSYTAAQRKVSNTPFHAATPTPMLPCRMGLPRRRPARCRRPASSWARMCCCSCRAWYAAAGTACTPSARWIRQRSS